MINPNETSVNNNDCSLKVDCLMIVETVDDEKNSDEDKNEKTKFFTENNSTDNTNPCLILPELPCTKETVEIVNSNMLSHNSSRINNENDGLTNCKDVHIGISQKHNLKIGCLNVRSLVHKVDQMQVFIDKHDFDILAINESWLDDTILDNEISLKSYIVLRNDRRKKGGGVCFYIKSGIKFSKLNMTTGIESLWISIKDGKSLVAVGTIYRPPNSDNTYFEKILDEIQYVTNKFRDLVILGDLNWNCASDSNNNEIVQIESMFNLKQIVKSPTRVTLHSATLLDIILTNNIEKCLNTSVVPISISDHFCVSTEYILNKGTEIKHKHNIITYRNYKNFNIYSFIDELLRHPGITNLNFEHDELLQRWDTFKNAFIEISNKHAPVTNRRLRDRYNPWMSSNILQLIYKRDYTKQQAVKKKSKEIWDKYCKIRNDVNTKIKNAKKTYYAEELDRCQGNSKKVWKFIERVTHKSKHTNPPTELTATDFNEYFSQIGEKVISEIDKPDNIMPWKGLKASTKFEFTNIENEVVKKTLSNFGSDSNSDVLGFDSKLLCISSHVISPLLSKLFNCSLLTSNVPNDWKLARVSPVYKGKGDIYDMGNYRPISVICHIGKVFEMQVHNQMLEYFQKYSYLNIDQSAYLKYHNTQTALHRVTDDWLDNMCNKLYTGICSLDIKKCFDTIDHKILLCKLENYGVHSSELVWFKSYLENRQQIVKCNGQKSDIQNISIGVPQGSILGPLLFIIYVNDISQHIHTGTASLYADDTLIYCDGMTVDDVNTKLQMCLDEVCKWYSGNNIVINAKKSSAMLVKSRHNNTNDVLKVNIYDQQLETLDILSYLGVQIDESLTWNEQVKKTCKTLSFKIKQLSRLSNILPEDILLKIYNSAIQPTIDYAISVWGSTSISNIRMIQRLQNLAARIIKKNFDYVNIRGIDLVKQLGWLNVKQRYLYFQHLTIFKSIHGMAPIHLVNNVTMEIEIANVNTRKHPMNLHIPRPINETHKRMLFYRGAKSWNELPGHIKDCYELSTFKQKLKHYLKSFV